MKTGIAISAGLLALAASTSVLAENIFLTWPGVNGSSVEPKYINAIPLRSYSQSFVKPVSLGQPGAGSGKTSCGVVTIIKQTDSSSTAFLTNGVIGTVIPKLTVNFTNPASGPNVTVSPVQIVLLNSYVTSVDQAVDTALANTSTLNETITLQASTIEVTYAPLDANGRFLAPQKFGWSCVLNQAVHF